MGMSGKIMGWVEKKYWFNWLKDLWDEIIYICEVLNTRHNKKYRERNRERNTKKNTHTDREKNSEKIFKLSK